MHKWRRRGQGEGDDGVALVVAIALVGLVSVMMLTLVSFSLREGRSTGRDRQRSSAVSTAEGAVDATLAAVQNVPVAQLPCDTLQPQSSGVGPDTLTIITTVLYYNSSNAPIACSAVKDGSATAAQALITATSTSNSLAGAAAAKRTVSTLVSMKATKAAAANAGLSKAIFGDAAISAANNLDLYGSTSSSTDADVYTNGNFVCNNNQSYRGSIYAQGSISMSNSCQVSGNSYAGTGYSSTNPQVKTTGNVVVANGTASISSGQVGGTVTAPTISAPSGFCTTGKCKYQSSDASTWKQSFPVLNFDEAAWRSAGYSNILTSSTVPALGQCGLTGDYNGPSKWIADNAATLTSDTVIVTPCQIYMQPNKNTISLAKNLAIFADQGVNLTNNLTFTSTDPSQSRNLYFIQPYGAVSHPCTMDGIQLNNQVTIDDSVDTLYYSPCNIRKANKTTVYGQIYAGGTAEIDNQMTMYFSPLPVYGVTSSTSTASNTVATYAVDVLYTREDQS